MREDGEITVEALAQRMAQAFEQQAGYPAGSATDVGIRIRTLAGELYALYARLEFSAGSPSRLRLPGRIWRSTRGCAAWSANRRGRRPAL